MQAPQRKDGLQAAPQTLGEQKPEVNGWPQRPLAPLCVTSDRSLPFSDLSGCPCDLSNLSLILLPISK